MRSKKTVFRIGDTVTVNNPEVFVRCGYPLTKADVLKEIDHQKLDEALFALGIYHSNPAFEQIKDRVAYGVLVNKSFGGKERKIYTKNDPNISGRKYKIYAKRIVKTGTYQDGWGGYDSWGEYDCDPPRLDKEKTRIILGLVPAEGYNYGVSFEIEETNVQKWDASLEFAKQGLTVKDLVVDEKIYEQINPKIFEKSFAAYPSPDPSQSYIVTTDPPKEKDATQTSFEVENIKLNNFDFGSCALESSVQKPKRKFYVLCEALSDEIEEIEAETRSKARYIKYKQIKEWYPGMESFRAIRVAAKKESLLQKKEI